MAQHFNIEDWKNESWYPKIIKTIQYWADKTKYSTNIGEVNKCIYNLPTDDYKMDDETTRVFVYKTNNIKNKIDQEQPNITINQCGFEVHMNGNQIQQIYVPL